MTLSPVRSCAVDRGQTRWLTPGRPGWPMARARRVSGIIMCRPEPASHAICASRRSPRRPIGIGSKPAAMQTGRIRRLLKKSPRIAPKARGESIRRSPGTGRLRGFGGHVRCRCDVEVAEFRAVARETVAGHAEAVREQNRYPANGARCIARQRFRERCGDDLVERRRQSGLRHDAQSRRVYPRPMMISAAMPATGQTSS